MKKLISGLVAAFLLSAGFVAVSAETASAVCKPTKYVQCKAVAVSTSGSTKSTKAGKKPKIVVKVRAQGAAPKGTVTITIKGKGVSISKTVPVRNGKVTYIGPKLKKAGKYKVIVSFKGASGYSDTKASYTITVKKPKKRR